MDFYNYILNHFSNFPFNAVTGYGNPTSFFSTLDGVNCIKENFIYGTNAVCNKEFIDCLDDIDVRDYCLYRVTNDDLYEKSIYTMSKNPHGSNTFKVYLEPVGFFTFIEDKFYYSYPEQDVFDIPSTLEEWFNLSMLMENILTPEEFDIINQIRKHVPSDINVEIYHDGWDEHKKSLTKDIKSIK